MEKTVPATVHKKHKKKKTNAFDFCIIQSFQSYYLYLAIDVFTEMCRKQKDRKVHTKRVRLFGNVTEIKQKMQGRQLLLGYLKKIYLLISTFMDLINGNS